jgi:hypothetical protein
MHRSVNFVGTWSRAKKFIDYVTDLLQNINQTDKDKLFNLCTSLI